MAEKLALELLLPKNGSDQAPAAAQWLSPR